MPTRAPTLGLGKNFTPAPNNVENCVSDPIVPDCPFEATAPTEEELMQMVAAHAAHTHGITEITPELAAKVKAAIQDRQSD